MGVVVLNTNHNYVGRPGRQIPLNGNPEEHAKNVWKYHIKDAKGN